MQKFVQRKSFPWLIVTVMLIVFFPIGIWMLARKMSVETFDYIKNGRTLQLIGGICIGFAVLYTLIGLTGGLETDDPSNVTSGIITVVAIFGSAGIIMLCKASGYINKGLKYGRYVAVINSRNDTLIDRIAADYPTTYEQAAADLQAMIGDGYFLNGYVDLDRRELVLPYTGAAPETGFETGMRDAASMYSMMGKITTPPAPVTPKSVQCKSCGATNKIIPGRTNECEYCGSPF